jgi:drug/metabolite transporter (DMT)-like permease
MERPWTLAPSVNSLLALAALAVFSTALAFVIYFRLIQTLGSIGATAQAYLRVPIGVAVGVVFLGEQLSSSAWIGLACVVVGVAAMTIPARKAKPIGEAV